MSRCPGGARLEGIKESLVTDARVGTRLTNGSRGRLEDMNLCLGIRKAFQVKLRNEVLISCDLTRTVVGCVFWSHRRLWLSPAFARHRGLPLLLCAEDFLRRPADL